MKIVLALFLLVSSFYTSAQVKVGQLAPEIALPDSKGDTVLLSSLKGKVVLIDFWASWCRPCRMSNPNVVRLYNKYKEKGFEVFAVSIDNKKSAWLKAVQQDKLTYTQVNDNKGWDAASAARYGVEGIPATFLLNKEGKIVAVDPEGAKLEEAVKELVNK
ncbi:MAG TPA: TlpA disulfide reductase family protein [Ferruginibacter sp.]|nr:TlpA disulfide reductase family protein [Ferruginibacter sp.]